MAITRNMIAVLLLSMTLVASVQRTAAVSVSQEKAYVYPVTLWIPALDLWAPIVHVGLESDGTMEVPDNAIDVGWFAHGVIPGEQGNAVLAGHLDTVSGKPAVFGFLHELDQGDAINVIMSDGSAIQFEVRRMEEYEQGKAPMEQIFGASSSIGLNLITCHGTWQDVNQSYDHRLIVYTEVVSPISL